jgi:glyoxylase-like metal-dependent hydrolase (beta-lactamase superfamily II)
MTGNTSEVQNIDDRVIKVSGASNFYVIDRRILIDTGDRGDRQKLQRVLSQEDIRIEQVLFTHLHFDHIANWDLVRDAEMFASREEIEDLNRDPKGTVLIPELALAFKSCRIKPFKLCKLDVIPTPGHTRGSVCFMMKDEMILFTGDTFFREGVYGRTDLPTSAPDLMAESLRSILAFRDFRICPGHDY